MEVVTKVGPSLQHWTTWGVRSEVLGVLARQLAEREPGQNLETQAAGPEPKVSRGVAVIPLKGLLTATPSLISLLFGGGGGLKGFRASLRGALAAEEVEAIVIDVDSPGGSTDLITETAAEIRAARGGKPIVAVANTMAASAAYWLASQADELVVTPSGEVGSIGVFALHWDESGFNEKLGVEPTFISAGKFKTEANPFEPLSDEARESLQQTIDEFYGLFVDDVARGRGVTASSVRDGFGEGRMVTAKRAVSLGMADRVETLEETISRVARVQRSEAPSLALSGPNVAYETFSSLIRQPDDKPSPKDASEEERARIAQVLTAHPTHVNKE